MPIGLTIHRQHASMPNPNLMRPDYPDEGAAGTRPSIVSHNIKSDAIARTRTGRGQGGVHRTTEGGGGWASTAQPKEGGSLAQPKEEGGSLAQQGGGGLARTAEGGGGLARTTEGGETQGGFHRTAPATLVARATIWG